MITQHTPGPWHAHRNHCYWDINSGEEHHSPTIAECCPSALNWGEDVAAANARLIAAAPDLLAALQRLAHPMAGDEDLDNARRVIASITNP